MKILKPSAYYEPEVFSSAHLNNDLEKALVENGDEIYIVTPQPSRGCTEEDYIKYKPREKKYDGHVNIERFKLMKEGKNVLKRAFRYIYMNFKQYLICSKYKDIDLIYAASTPPTQGVLAALLKKRLKKPFVYNLQDVFPDSMVNAKMTKKGSLIWKIGRIVEDFTYRNADKIIVISDDFKKNIIEKGVPENKIVVIPNWVDTESVYPVKRKDNILFNRYNLDRKKFYICYSGNIGFSQNFELLLKAAQKLEKELPDVHFLVIGDGAYKPNLIEGIRETKIHNMTLLPFQPYEDIAHVFSLGDVGLIISKPGIGESSVPSKTWSIMAAEKPILASFDLKSNLCCLINKVNCGEVVGSDDEIGFLSAVKKMYKKGNDNLGTNGYKFIHEHLSKKSCLDRYLDVFINISKGECKNGKEENTNI